MNTELIILVLLIATALAFDFTNGFHDTGNAMATSIATGALKPKLAVLLAGVLNLVGAFLSVEVAVTVPTSVLKVQDSDTGRLLPGIDASTGLTIIFWSPPAAPGWSTGSPARFCTAAARTGSAGARSQRPPWSHSRTAPTTPRRPWV